MRIAIHTLIGYENVLPIYEIDEFGNVYSHSKAKLGKALKQSQNERGYHLVRLRLRNEEEQRYINALVHKLVALAFVEGYEEGLQADHVDGNNQKNYCTNLKWTTPKQNVHNPNTFQRFVKANRKSHKAKRVIVKDTISGKSRIFPSTSMAAKYIGYKSNSIVISKSKGYRKIRHYEVREVEK